MSVELPKDWKQWLAIAVVVLTAILQAFNTDAKTEDVKNKVEKKIEEKLTPIETKMSSMEGYLAKQSVSGK